MAAKLSSCLARKVSHVRLTEEQKVQDFVSHGVPDHYAKFLTSLEVSAADGGQEITNDVVEKVTGRRPKNFDTFTQEKKAAWQ